MLFSIFCTDKPDHGALRAATRDTHLAYLAEQGDAVVWGGPLLNEGGAPVGSLVVVEQPDLAAAQALAAADPYALAGLFETVRVSAHRLVIRDGKRVG